MGSGRASSSVSRACSTRFSAPLDAQAVALLERRPEVAGVYPVRIAYPASVSSELLGKTGLAHGAGHLPAVSLPGYDGRGVTIALLDTGVDRAQPHLRGRVLHGIDVINQRDGAPAVADPGDSSRVEHHGTELAGILVGAGGPAGITGVATGASVLPIRVAGWQRDLKGGWAVYSRTDQLIQGLERAVDPNVDGDAHDAARIALIGVAASYGAFADSPEARAIRGALRLDTLVVAPVGNDGPAGPAYGSVSSPGGAPYALTVGAADLRSEAEEVPVGAARGPRPAARPATAARRRRGRFAPGGARARARRGRQPRARAARSSRSSSTAMGSASSPARPPSCTAARIPSSQRSLQRAPGQRPWCSTARSFLPAGSASTRASTCPC